MATIEEALIAYLLADPVVGVQTAGRVFPQRAPQGRPFPRVTVFRTGGERTKSMNLGRSGQALASFQVDVWSNDVVSYATAKGLANRIGLILDGYPRPAVGQQSGYLGNLVQVQGVFLDEDPDSILPPVHGDEIGVDTISQAFRVWYVEP